MTEKLIVSWEEYNQTVEKLAIQIDESGYKPTILIGIMRGAAPMIDVLSRVFKLKCAYLAVESYSGKGIEDEQGDIVFSREMSSIAPNMGGRILLCDDLSDTGITFNKSIDWLKKYKPIENKIEDIKTATLWKKNKSTFDPDFCAVKLKSNPWIVQPFEVYEEIRIEDIKKKTSEIKKAIFIDRLLNLVLNFLLSYSKTNYTKCSNNPYSWTNIHSSSKDFDCSIRNKCQCYSMRN